MSKTLEVTVDIKPITLKIDVPENTNEKDVIKMAQQMVKNAVILNTAFPSASYLMSNVVEEGLSFETAAIGMAVKVVNREKYGVIVKVSERTLTVVLGSNDATPTVVEQHPMVFQKVNNFPEPSKFPIRKGDYVGGELWLCGHIGFLAEHKNKQVHPVVLVKKFPKKELYQFHALNGEAQWKIPYASVTHLVFDSYEDAEKALTGSPR